MSEVKKKRPRVTCLCGHMLIRHPKTCWVQKVHALAEQVRADYQPAVDAGEDVNVTIIVTGREDE